MRYKTILNVIVVVILAFFAGPILTGAILGLLGFGEGSLIYGILLLGLPIGFFWILGGSGQDYLN